jgi:Fic family protein
MQTRNIEDFEAGKRIERLEYKSFSPNPIHLQWLIQQPELLNKLGKADRMLGRLDAYSSLIPDIDFFIRMHIAKEATVSSKIEGTQTSFQEALIEEQNIQPEKRDDWQEVNAYIRAMHQAMDEMKELPISNRLIKQTHKTLLDNVRGKEKLPGEYRSSQNWIGSSLKNAVFVPPTHEEIPELMADLEKFINSEKLQQAISIPHLIKIAMIHYQFETIHPFLDGNGRIGRLLITLYLLDKEILKQPTLYLSEFFERNRKDYYDNLMLVRMGGGITHWLDFFIQGVIETAENSIKTFENIIELRNDIELNRLIQLGRKQADAKKLINELYKSPLLSTQEVAGRLSIHSSTAYRLIADFEKLGILEEITGYGRNRLYAFKEYIDLFS